MSYIYFRCMRNISSLMANKERCFYADLSKYVIFTGKVKRICLCFTLEIL